jgi:hypothetical protein
MVCFNMFNSKEMGVKLVMRITSLLLLTYGLAEAKAPIAKPGCPTDCGNVSIPYPFGTRRGCYMNQSFEIVCNGTGSSTKAFLPSFYMMEVLTISISDPDYIIYEPGVIRVNMPIISSSNCNLSRSRSGGVDMTGSPFFLSSYRNTFISVGCNNMALMTGIDPMVVVGCISDCNNKSMTDKEVKCSGFNCCQTTVPIGIQVLNVDFKRIDESKASEECKYAFLADRQWLESNNTDPSYDVQHLEYVPVFLEWTASPNFSNMESSTELRRRNAFWYYTSYGVRFYSCLRGYEGNPYLPTGCQGKLKFKYHK